MSRRRKSPVKTDVVETHMCDLHMRLSILQQVPFFAHLSSDEIALINGAFREFGYLPDDTIYFSGDSASHLYVVASGQIKLLRHTAEGQDVLVDILSVGDFFGTLSSLDEDTYSDTAQAQTAVCVLSMSAKEFRALLVRYPSVALAVLDITSKRLHDAREMLRQLSAHSIEKRIAHVLLKLGKKLGEAQDEGLLIQMPLTRDDIAQMTGSTSETASRVMSQLQKQGIIRSGRQWVAIVDLAWLASIAEETNS